MTHKVCIIGAGSSGIAAAKICAEHSIAFDCFEKGSGIGGNWRYLNDNGQSSAYASLHINTSKERMAFSDFPLPAEYPNYPHHSQILEYFERYVDHFGLRERITFRTEVTQVAPTPSSEWAVTLQPPDGPPRSERYRAVLVANGHHWNPRRPSFPGQFAGRELHSHDYKTPESFAGRRVLVVGIGNSAVDIACEVSRVAAQTWLSTRQSAHIVPKYVLGRPFDLWSTPAITRLPLWVQRVLFMPLLRLSRGRQTTYGLPEPQHKLLSAHPTVSSDLLNLIGHGRIIVKPNIAALAGERVRFSDGSDEQIDVIIYATGYRVSFPFFDPALIRARENALPLYLRVVHPGHANLFFIGLLQPLGAIMPLAEIQARWVAALLTGQCALPDRETMWREIARTHQQLRRRYVASARHTMQVDFFPYLRAVQREISRGRQRAAAQGGAISSPVGQAIRSAGER